VNDCRGLKRKKSASGARDGDDVAPDKYIAIFKVGKQCEGGEVGYERRPRRLLKVHCTITF
jgi:hypothetical protein